MTINEIIKIINTGGYKMPKCLITIRLVKKKAVIKPMVELRKIVENVKSVDTKKLKTSKKVKIGVSGVVRIIREIVNAQKTKVNMRVGK
ncbi:MAG: hypothetical protein KatS3mg088_167 [Patescibacteria group bacterium]|nr:MAG: hypothetical protein KatS3mg088_167 [Patescibacteria group bacterium]